MSVIKDEFKQYNEIAEEIKKIQEEIKETENSIEQLTKNGTVVDKVRGGLGGIQGFKIEGFPQKEYDRRMKLLQSKQNRLLKKQNDLLEIKEKMEIFIDNIPNSRDRQIVKATFVQNKTQKQIAKEMYIDRSLVSKIINKYL